MDSKKSNKIRQIVRLQQILKKWKHLANASKNSTSSASNSSSHPTTTSSSGGGCKSIKFLKRTLSLADVSEAAIPKGFLAVCVGKELKRFIIPTEYLGHQAFGILLRRAEEEFGFQQEGVLKIPCEVDLFEKILDLVQHKKDDDENNLFWHEFGFNVEKEIIGCFSPDSELMSSHHPQTCR